MPSISFWMFKTVGTIKSGGSFGERALIRNETRAATIKCKTNCSFATLSRIDFNFVLGMAQKREMK